MIGRRRFMALLGVGTASAPLAAKAALEDQQLALTRMGSELATAGARASTDYYDDDETKAAEMARSYVKLFGVPKHVEEKARQNAMYVRHLDYDIACKRSWSLAAKIHEQRQRNYTRAMEGYRDVNWFGEAQTTFKKISG